jgi:hypothetical protein
VRFFASGPYSLSWGSSRGSAGLALTRLMTKGSPPLVLVGVTNRD